MAFTNPIETARGASTAPPAPQPTNSTAGDALQIAQFGLGLMGQRQQQEAQAQQGQALFQSESTAIQRIDRAAEIRREKGAVHAQRFLAESYRSDLRSMNSSEERSAYIQSFKDMWGGSPVQDVQDFEMQQEQERMERITEGQNLLLGDGFSPQEIQEFTPESLALISREREGRAMRIADAQQAANLEIANINNQEAKNGVATRLGMDMFNEGFTEQAENIRLLMINAGEGTYEEHKSNALNMLRNLRGNLRHEMTQTVQGVEVEGGVGSANYISDSDVSAYTARIDELERWITGDFAREQNDQQAAFAESALRRVVSENPNDLELRMMYGKIYGQQMDVNIGVGDIMSDGRRDRLRDVETTARITVGSARTPVSQLLHYSPMPEVALREFGQSWSQLPADLPDDQANEAGHMLGEAMAGTFEGGSRSRNLANSSNGTIVQHRKMANDPEFARRVWQGLTEVASDRGMTPEQMYQEEMSSFVNRTLLPSLRTSGTEGDRNLLQEVRAVPRGNKIVLEYQGARQTTARREYGRQVPSTAGGYPTGRAAGTRFQADLNTAARELNTLVQSYANGSGSDASAMVQSEAEAINLWLDGMFGRESEQEAPERTSPQRTGVEATEEGAVRASF